MTSKKNENRTTEVKFMFWSAEDNQDGKPYEKTEKIPYTRSAEIARKVLCEKYPDAMVQVIEPLIQEEIKRTVYHPQLVFENMICDFETEDAANNSLVDDSQTVVPYTMYIYSGQFWAVNSNGDYITDYVMDNSPCKFTKINARAFLKISAENLEPDYTVLAIHGDERKAETRYAVVNNEDLQKCVKES